MAWAMVLTEEMARSGEFWKYFKRFSDELDIKQEQEKNHPRTFGLSYWKFGVTVNKIGILQVK